MAQNENLNYTKITNWKIFNWTIFSKEEASTQSLTKGLPLQINVTQDYYNKEFKNVDQN